MGDAADDARKAGAEQPTLGVRVSVRGDARAATQADVSQPAPGDEDDQMKTNGQDFSNLAAG